MKELLEVGQCFCAAGNIMVIRSVGVTAVIVSFLCVTCTFSPHKFIKDECLI